MEKLISLGLILCVAALASALDHSKVIIDTSEDLKAEESRSRIYDIIHSHEGRKYGDHGHARNHGGHEYEDGEQPLKLASHKQYGYLPLPGKNPVYYEAPKAKDNVYRENVAAYAAKSAPVHVVHHAPARPVSHSYYTAPAPKPHYAVVHPKSHYAVANPKPDYVVAGPKSHYVVADPKPDYVVAGPKPHYAIDGPSHNQYVVFDDHKPHHKRPLIVDPKPSGSYILEEPEYVVPDHQVVVKPPVVSHAPHYHHPVKDYSHHVDDHHVEDKGYQNSGHGYHGDNSVHGDSGHKAHKNYEVSGHKEHSTKAGHHDEHDHHHNKGHYERDRGYHYEKAYAYDRIRASHDIGSDKGSHSDYHSHHGQEGHKEKGDHGSQSYMYFKKNDNHGGHGHHEQANSLHKTGHGGSHGYHEYPHQHAYGK